MIHFLGIDGGGSNLRVALINEDLTIINEVTRQTVNPNHIGRNQSASIIQDAITGILDNTDIVAEEISAVGIGLAGAPANIASDWLINTVQSVLPTTTVIPSSDHEIALVGAHGKREGILLLSGTGSLAYGINPEGNSKLVGAWGYATGDEGSGYWIGNTAIRSILKSYDGRIGRTILTETLLQKLELTDEWALVDWFYQTSTPRDIAGLARLVMDCATQGDAVSLDIIDQATAHLYELVASVSNQLQMPINPIAFTGGVLSSETIIAKKMQTKLNLTDYPHPKYKPVVGAALLAKEAYLNV